MHSLCHRACKLVFVAGRNMTSLMSSRTFPTLTPLPYLPTLHRLAESCLFRHSGETNPTLSEWTPARCLVGESRGGGRRAGGRCEMRDRGGREEGERRGGGRGKGAPQGFIPSGAAGRDRPQHASQDRLRMGRRSFRSGRVYIPKRVPPQSTTQRTTRPRKQGNRSV